VFARDIDFTLAGSYPEARAATDAVVAGDRPALAAVFDAADAPTRSVLVRAVADDKDAERHLWSWHQADPTDAMVGTMLGVSLINRAWEIRSGLGAQYVSAAQFEGFFTHLRQAERILIDVVARRPDFGPGWENRITTARGLQLGQAESRRRYDHAIRALPGHFLTQSKYLQQICPKWGGDFGTLHAFARTCADAAPAGSHSPTLVAEAHLEQWLDLTNKGGADQYIRSPQVRSEIRSAADRSVRHPDFARTGGWVYAMNSFALAGSLCEEYDLAAYCFAQLDGRGSEHPWGYLGGDTAANYRSMRTKAYDKAGRP
jgi:hypothetical protein